ncbi:DUF411 domain-containing protein [Coralloluteibacterium thermophilus]|uniref:DUF411 domain-containing protein n=1 Tax=Coralloluteibacterium thermophilum TaxID=2707049 RepID=A0ABV9NQ22_9GAMM
MSRFFALALAVAACAVAPALAGGPAAAAEARAGLPPVTVHKSPACGCCGKWIEYLEAAGFEVRVRDTHELGAVKKQALGMPMSMASCHTAEIDGYVVEGHVPVGDIHRLLAERPQARGIAVPGMPLGSPGMETVDGRVEPYATLLVADDGSATVFARHGEGNEEK